MIYPLSEDSFLLSSFVEKEIKKNKKGKILDMGAGLGIQSETCINLGFNPKNLTLTDINKEALKILRKKFPKSKVIFSDLFENISDKFDLIIFNPPYLPEDLREPEDSKINTTGGKKGGEIINKFLRQARKHLNKKGKILLLTSSLTKGIFFSDYNRKLLGTKKLFFEELYVWELRPLSCSEKNS